MTAPAPEQGDDQVAVVEANAEFYAAFEATDLDRMSSVWDDRDDVACVHPGWPPVHGRGHVLRSWAVIMANTSYIQFVLTDVRVRLGVDLAVLTCDENILTGVGGPDADGSGLGDTARVTATNVYRRRSDGWRLWVHHGSPVLAPTVQ